eukprot:6116702-Amphidinium_carterae.1
MQKEDAGCLQWVVISDSSPPADWPQRGAIEFCDVWLSYRAGLPAVLRGVNLKVSAGDKVLLSKIRHRRNELYSTLCYYWTIRIVCDV